MVPPVQILDAILSGIPTTPPLARSDVMGFRAKHHGLPQARSSFSSNINASWIEGLCRFLSHEWIDMSLITTKALKHDKAVAPSHLWDARLELLFPGIAPHVSLFRRCMLNRYRLSILREIRLYLVQRYGVSWPAVLQQSRRASMLGRLNPRTGGRRSKTKTKTTTTS
jgi:hypothetical protein